MYIIKNKTMMPLTVQGQTILGKGTCKIKNVDMQTSDLMQTGIIKVSILRSKTKEIKKDKKKDKKEDKKEDII